MLEDEEMDELG